VYGTVLYTTSSRTVEDPTVLYMYGSSSNRKQCGFAVNIHVQIYPLLMQYCCIPKVPYSSLRRTWASKLMGSGISAMAAGAVGVTPSLGVVPAHSRTFFGYVPETAKTASRDEGGKGSDVGYLGALACAEHDARGGKSRKSQSVSVNLYKKVDTGCMHAVIVHGWPACWSRDQGPDLGRRLLLAGNY
jgi:hypothetical protein